MMFLLSLLLAATPAPLIIDTDAGSDDLLAISYLLARADIPIEAITVVSGVAHVHPGAMNVLRLIEAAGRRNIPVYEGSAETPAGGHAFPADWRKAADEIPLPTTKLQPQPQPAVAFLKTRITGGTAGGTAKPCRILALGPLTNLAAALGPKNAVEKLVIMGGAVRVPGNIGDAEWNIYADPRAAEKVFQAGLPIELIPLDATNKVPIDAAYISRFRKEANTTLGKLATQILATSPPPFAWDPLAAIALTNPEVATTVPLALSIGPLGRTQEVPQKAANAQVALNANAALFQKLFLQAFRISRE
jgi:inosine-uridine nucleoside N-ribohydrolase